MTHRRCGRAVATMRRRPVPPGYRSRRLRRRAPAELAAVIITPRPRRRLTGGTRTICLPIKPRAAHERPYRSRTPHPLPYAAQCPGDLSVMAGGHQSQVHHRRRNLPPPPGAFGREIRGGHHRPALASFPSPVKAGAKSGAKKTPSNRAKKPETAGNKKPPTSRRLFRCKIRL